MASRRAAARGAILALCLGVPVLFALAAALLPQDNNWDLRNYHWYNPYALLHGRMGFDLAPAQTPTYYNPLLDVPFYLGAQVLPARVLAFLLGLVQGCNFILLFFLARRTLKLDGAAALWAPAAIALLGLVGGGHIGLIGTTFYDNVTSLFVLGALLVVVGGEEIIAPRAEVVAPRTEIVAPRAGINLPGAGSAAFVRVFLAGVLVGLAVGLKLPSQVFAVGICFGLLFIPGPFTRRFTLAFVCGLGVIAGFLVTGGWWIARMWTEFANPLFPYMNQIFRSPWTLPEAHRDIRFLPHSFQDALLFPFRFARDSKIGGEIAFTDWRVAAAYAVLILTGLLALARPRPADAGASVSAVRYLVAASVLSYAVWLTIFAIYRYITPLEMLAPLMIVAAVALWPIPRKARVLAAAALLVLVAVTARPGDWNRAPWAPGLGGPFVSVEVPALDDPANTLVVMTGLAPDAFVIPAFPPEIAFLRPVSYLAGPDEDTLFIRTVKDRLAAHRGPLLALVPSWDRENADKALPALGLTIDYSGCRKLPTNLDQTLELCPMRRGP